MKMMIAEAQDTANNSLGESFLKSLSLLEQAHRRLHDVVKDDLERGGERSLTGVQALLLYEIGEGKPPHLFFGLVAPLLAPASPTTSRNSRKAAI